MITGATKTIALSTRFLSHKDPSSAGAAFDQYAGNLFFTERNHQFIKVDQSFFCRYFQNLSAEFFISFLLS